MNKKRIIFICCFAILIASSIAFVQHQQNNHITGTWISETDQDSKWVFTNDSKTKWYYEGELMDTFTFRVSTTSPQCGEQVQTSPRIEFLELTNVNDENQLCYYLNGLTDSTLSLSPFGRSTILRFER